MYDINLIEIIKKIDPSRLDYSQWIQVGQALKYEGYTAYDWEQWSSRDSIRHKPGECYRKWESFQRDGVTGGTVFHLAKEQGFSFNSDNGHELDWDSPIEKDELVIIDHHYLEGKEIEEPLDDKWNPVQDLIKYLQVLFESTENVGYVTDTYVNDDGKYLPTRGNYDRTAGQLIQELSKCKGDIGAVIGDTKLDAGAWIRFNPLDGKGVKNDNVTDYRYALVESDSVAVDKQNAIIRELELPVAALVYSGGKSVHAIVRIEAGSYEEYRKRVNYLYDVCKKNGLTIDTQNRNPSRLSRMPGIMRKDKKQFLMDTNIGKKTWDEWFEWIEGINDDLPEPESLTSVWDNLPKLADPLIDGILRQGHKMLVAGPSKAGKSFLLIELCIAIAEGNKWLNWNCSKGKVMYVNLELDRASCLHRFKDVYQSLGIPPKSLHNIDIWNLRGKSVPMDKLAPKLIRRAAKKGYIAIVIDPIYKVITGDENSADQMAHFTNQFDKVCTELGSSVIYCHHHSKGNQGNKRSMDRASGSGVFARDPDALLDLVELEVTDDLWKFEIDKNAANIATEIIKKYNPNYYKENVGQDDIMSKFQMLEHAETSLSQQEFYKLRLTIDKITEDIKKRSAWRVEGTLREYPKFNPVNMWFEYPVHVLDNAGGLEAVEPEGTFGTQIQRSKGVESRRKQGRNTDDRIRDAIDSLISFGEEPTFKDIANYFEDNSGTSKGASPKRIKDFIEKNLGEYSLIIKEGERANRVTKQVGVKSN